MTARARRGSAWNWCEDASAANARSAASCSMSTPRNFRKSGRALRASRRHGLLDSRDAVSGLSKLPLRLAPFGLSGRGLAPGQKRRSGGFSDRRRPPPLSQASGIRLMMVGPKEQAITPAFLDYVSRLIAAEVRSSWRFPAQRVTFRPGLSLTMRSRRRQGPRPRRGRTIISAALGGLATHRFNPVRHRHGTGSEG